MNAPRRRHLPALFLAAMALPLAACSSHHAPSFRVTGAELASQSESSSVIMVTIEGENPNPDPLPLYAVQYHASIDGSAGGSSIERSPERTLPRFGTASFQVPVVVPNEQLGGPVAMLAFDGSVVYQLPGTIAQVFFDNDIRRPHVPVSGETPIELSATVPMPATP